MHSYFSTAVPSIYRRSLIMVLCIQHFHPYAPWWMFLLTIPPYLLLSAFYCLPTYFRPSTAFRLLFPFPSFLGLFLTGSLFPLVSSSGHAPGHFGTWIATSPLPAALSLFFW
ncbi:hypothetical protein EV426DRAFT_619464 [Tirmania nivea]|nr:hypothetical protein EV426DRAFT_619464 [Tirmania nivea]